MAQNGGVFEGSVLSLAGNDRVRRLIERSPGSREVLHRFIAGDTAYTALSAARDLQATGRSVTIAHLGADGSDDASAAATVAELLGLLDVAEATGRTGDGALDVSIRPAALGDLLAPEGSPERGRLLDRARRLCRAAANADATITLDMEGPDVVDATLALAAELRQDFPDVGVAVQASLARSEEDCRALAEAGARVRLCKGAFSDDGSGVGSRHDVDRAFIRCLRILLGGRGYVMVATHDQRLVDITDSLAAALDRPRGTYEYQMYLGVRPLGQTSLADRGDSVRVYVPYGPAWYSYLMARVAERPSTTVGLMRSVLRLH